MTIQNKVLYLYQNLILIIKKNKMESLNIATATKSQMESAFIFDEKLEAYLGGFDIAAEMTEDELRKKITNYIVENNETE